MLTAWSAVLVALLYVGALFLIASFGDRAERQRPRGTPRPFIYALSLGVYCTSWTYFGSVGLAATTGFDFLPIYIGPILMLALGWPLLRAIVEVSKRQNITSIADFISARYGKNQMLGALVAVIAVIGIIPYISLQLKAVSFSLTTVLPAAGALPSLIHFEAADDLALIVTAAMACFAMLFGTRHIDTTEHQAGLILAIAVESIVKLAAFLVVGAFVTFWLMGGIGSLYDQAAARPGALELFSRGFEGGRWLTMTLLAFFAILLLPRQFHVTVVENSSLGDVRRAAWIFPLYLVAINIFVVPVAIAGLLLLPAGTDADTYVLALPVATGHPVLAMIAFIGGLSAATAMVIMESIALSIMVCNNLVVPILVRHRLAGAAQGDMGSALLFIRRIAIAVVLALAYGYYQMTGSSAALAQTGLLSFAAVAQFAPAFFGGLIWRRGTARGAMAGILAGFAVWLYTLLIPSFVDAGWFSPALLSEGPFGIGLLRPRMLFNMAFDPLTHGVIWSLAANVCAYVAVSLLRDPSPIERLQANAFVKPDLPAPVSGFRNWRTAVTMGELEATVARYIGLERAQAAFAEFAVTRKGDLDPAVEADIRALRFAEHLVASAVGVASARLVLGLLLERHAKASRDAVRLLDDASEAIQHSRDVLQSAIDHMRQGVAVFDRQLHLVSWNGQLGELLGLPPDLVRIGAPLDAIVLALARRAGHSGQEADRNLVETVRRLATGFEPYEERIAETGKVLQVRSSRMPDGGIVATFTDITEKVEAAEALMRANTSLERRVEERTAELVKLNSALAHAKAEAEAANLGKTRFIAAASHDILQPLNAARLFTSSLVEREAGSDRNELVRHLDSSLEAVEEILSALLDISRLDAGALRPELGVFRIDDILNALAVEFAPAAREKGIELRLVPCGLAVRSDRKLLRRVLQNLVSNAVKYTASGKVLMGCRRRGSRLRIEVRDTGVGIPRSKLKTVFREFERLGQEAVPQPGLGLGLAIVERIVRVLDHGIDVASEPGRGSAFSISVPVAALMPGSTAASPAARPRAGDLAGRTVLVIDNEPAILDGMRTLMSGWGITVLTAAGGDEALARLRESADPVDVVLADYHLSGENGLQVIGRLGREDGRSVPSVLITADRTQAVRKAAVEAGVLYLRKPVKPASLRALLAQLAVRAEAAE
ncbi:MAG: NahK/ErcS family hybrid sensor histidine kinase/response regulator [Parvibaculaceae bacterium]